VEPVAGRSKGTMKGRDMQAKNPWIFCPRPIASPRFRLICVPFAGRGASVYREWPQLMPPDVEMCALQLPGRENRQKDRPFTRLSEAVQEAAEVLQPYLDVPYALFGHSIGALICFELARSQRRQHRPGPVHFFVSGRRAPHLPDPRPHMHPLPNEQFVAEILRRFNGIPEGVLREPDLMEMLLPMLRADVEMIETHEYEAEAALDCPITVFGGREDTEARFEELVAWRQHTSSSFQTEILPGDHFFIQSAQKQIVETVFRQLNLEEDFTRSNNGASILLG
jgi:medium-chain acyl-[acyl-carrier-protein] hydrolase